VVTGAAHIFNRLLDGRIGGRSGVLDEVSVAAQNIRQGIARCLNVGPLDSVYQTVDAKPHFDAVDDQGGTEVEGHTVPMGRMRAQDLDGVERRCWIKRQEPLRIGVEAQRHPNILVPEPSKVVVIERDVQSVPIAAALPQFEAASVATGNGDWQLGANTTGNPKLTVRSVDIVVARENRLELVVYFERATSWEVQTAARIHTVCRSVPLLVHRYRDTPVRRHQAIRHRLRGGNKAAVSIDVAV
jgi:hypothetical protein